MRHAIPARIAAMAVVLVAFVGLAQASIPVCPATHCMFVPLLRQGQAELFPTATPTSTLIPTASATASSTSMATATLTTTATATTTDTATPTATATPTKTGTPTAGNQNCIVPNFIGLQRALLQACGTVRTL
jgi:hypothetical protein